MAVRHDEHPTERVEHIEQLRADRDATGTTVTVGTVPAVARPVWTLTGVVTLLFTVLEVLLLVRFVLKLTGANPNQALVDGLYRLTEPLTRPFQGIFPEPAGPPVLDIPALLAIVFLFLVGALLVALVRAITLPRPA